MNVTLEAQFLKEFRRRALQRADALQQKRQFVAQKQHTLAALQEVTGLSRTEIETIAVDVERSFQVSHDDFFSIKTQMLITFCILSLILMLCGLMTII